MVIGFSPRRMRASGRAGQRKFLRAMGNLLTAIEQRRSRWLHVARRWQDRDFAGNSEVLHLIPTRRLVDHGLVALADL